jgi:tetratricopeptide (TPR) repeat protein
MGSHDVALQFLREGQRHQFAEPPNDLAAEKAYRSATLTAPEWGEPYHWLGAVLESQGRTKEAVEAYQQAIRLLPADPRPLIALGRLQTTCGHYADAISLLEAGLALKPHYAEADARLFLAEVLERSGAVEKAVAQWQVVLRMEPTYPSHHLPMEEAKRKLNEHGQDLPTEFSELPEFPSVAWTTNGPRANRRAAVKAVSSRGFARWYLKSSTPRRQVRFIRSATLMSSCRGRTSEQVSRTVQNFRTRRIEINFSHVGLNKRFNQRHLFAGKALVLLHRQQDVSKAAAVGNEMRSLFGAARVQIEFPAGKCRVGQRGLQGYMQPGGIPAAEGQALGSTV